MKVAITGATGFLGHYIVRKMLSEGNSCRCWFRSEKAEFPEADSSDQIEWLHGELGDRAACDELVAGCDAVVHSGLHRVGETFRCCEGNDIARFVQKNVVGTIELIEAARAAGVRRFVFVSTCAVHEKILQDRPLDEAHPLWMTTHYGAYKASVEQFVHSYGFGTGYAICAVRPTGIYGLHHHPEASKWYELIRDVCQGKAVECRHGGKEVHAADVAEAVDILLHEDDIAGEVYSCCDLYVSDYEVAQAAKEICGSDAEIRGEATEPKNRIVCDKLQALGMEFGGEALLRRTISEIIEAGSFC